MYVTPSTIRLCKVAKHLADACIPTDLYQRVGGSSEPPEPPPAYGPAECETLTLGPLPEWY